MSTEHIVSSLIRTTLPNSLSHLQSQLLHEINQLVHYSPTIGLMGKTGVGKSSLCNALFQSHVSAVSDVESGTQTAKQLQMTLGKRTLTLIDFPGIGESLSCDKTYQALYQQMLPELDLIIWVLKADDRAWTSDEVTYHFLTQHCGYQAAQFLFVINQADKIEPCREWDVHACHPSHQQANHLQLKIDAVQKAFSPHHPVIAISAKEGYQIDVFVEHFIHALPAKASSSTLTQLKPAYRTEYINSQAKQDFGQCVNKAMDDLIYQLPLPVEIKDTFIQIKDTLVSAVVSLWRWLF
ncbi:GTPase family protein [Providencia hangzhouensis]|uniref:GTPase family protein n=1 Tax=Providencia hangzhouensis TaxID=3031799 RepID=UPI0034DD790B